MILDGFHHGFGVGCLLESLPEFCLVKELGDIGQGVKVFLELSLRDEKEHDERDGLVIEGVEVDAFLRAAQCADDFRDEVRGGVGDANAEANTGAHRILALSHHCGDGCAVVRFDAACCYEDVNQLVNGFPASCSLQIRQDLVLRQNISKFHTLMRRAFGLKREMISRQNSGIK
jgi:hypothetical protein